MIVSTRGRYALRVLLDLCNGDPDAFVPMKEIAKREGISVKYMEQIIPMLTKAGYLKSFRGSNGGYQLTRLPSEYTLGEYENWPDEKWIDVSQREWRNYIVSKGNDTNDIEELLLNSEGKI